MGDGRRNKYGWSTDDTSAHPDSPAGGEGSGFFYTPDEPRARLGAPHPYSPAARAFDWALARGVDLSHRADTVQEAVWRAHRYAPDAIWKATGFKLLGEILVGSIVGILLALVMVGGTTALGAAFGAAVGVLFSGVGAGPGAALGAGAGFEAGVALLQGLGLGALVQYVGQSLSEALGCTTDGVRLAWEAPREPLGREDAIERAAERMAEGVGVLVRGILEGGVAYLVSKGASKAAERVPELVDTLRASKLGEDFATWIERNWFSLVNDERFLPKPKATGGGAAGHASSSSGSASRSTGTSARGRLAVNRSISAAEQATSKQTSSGDSRAPAAASASAGETPEAPASEGTPVPLSQVTSTADPVDVATGKVFVDTLDLALPGVLGCTWQRIWYSTSAYAGPLGHGWHHGYDARLQLEAEAVRYHTADGRSVVFPRLAEGAEHFDRKERLTLLRDARGYGVRTHDQLMYRFSPAPRGAGLFLLTAIEHPGGRRLQLQYDPAGKLLELKDGARRSIGVTHDPHGRITALSVPHPERPEQRLVAVRYAYDPHGNLSQVTDALGNRENYRYAGHQLVQKTDRSGLSFYYEYDGTSSKARCIHTWGDGGIYDHKLRYDLSGGITSVENSLGEKTLYQHRGGLVVRRVDPLGATTLTEYDEVNQKRHETDALGQRTSYFYDARGNLGRVVRPDGVEVRAQYDAANLLQRVSEGGARGYHFAYDAAGRLTERADPLGGRTRYSYEGLELAAIVDVAGHRYEFEHDAAGNLTQLRSPDGAVRRWTYDALGWLRSAVDPQSNEQQLERDLLGRVTRVQEPDGNVRELEYDAEGRVTRSKDKHRDTQASYRGMGLLALLREAGTTVHFEYDTEERLRAVHNEHGRAYRFALGPSGHVEAEQGFDGRKREYERDLLGRLTELRRPSGQTTRYQYDALHRLVAVEHADGEHEHYTYDTAGRLIEATNGSCQLRLERDALGRICKESRDTHWVQNDYDARGLRVRVRSSLGADQRLGRTAVGTLQSVEAGAFQAQISRDLLGLEIERTLPGGVRSRWRRDALGRPLQHQVQAHDLTLRTSSYSWEADARLMQLIDSDHGLVRYGYDSRARLAWAHYVDGTAELRIPDEVGNLYRNETRKDRVYGPAGELLETIGARGRVTKYTYDADGNLSEKLEPANQRWQYTWNTAGRLTQVTRPDGSHVNFAYDALGRRIQKHHRGQTSHYLWDGNALLHEWIEGQLAPIEAPTAPPPSLDARAKQREADLQAHLAQGPPERGTRETPITWLFEPESHIPMAKLIGDQAYSIIADHLGTPKLMLGQAGQLVWSASINTYGDLHHQKGSRHTCPFRWQGQYEDAETGLYYNRHRYYDPASGQYLSQDPTRLEGGLRAYGYCENPLGWVDPLGLCGERGGSRAQGSNVAYRALNAADAEAIAAGRGLSATAPNGTWTAAEHVANTGPGAGGAAANSPWLSTTRRLDVARAYDSGNGVVAIDLNRVSSFSTEVWRSAPRVDGVAGLPYHRSIWAQEVTVFQSIPREAIMGFVP